MNRKSRKKEALTPYERRKRRLEKRFSTAPKTTGQKVAGAVIDNICWIVGCSLYSIGVVAFALPNSIAQSGTTGLATHDGSAKIASAAFFSASSVIFGSRKQSESNVCCSPKSSFR